MFVRERILTDKNQLFLLDFRSREKFNAFRLFKSQHFDLNSINPNNRESISHFKSMIHFKHVFFIADALDFDSDHFRLILSLLVEHEMKPFCIFLHRINLDIIELEYPHLLLRNEEKKKLTLYPLIILKCKDINQQESKIRFQLLLG